MRKNVQKDIEYIKQVMQDSRKTLVDDGSGFIFWGLLVGVWFLVWFAALTFELPWNIHIIGLILFSGGIVYTLWSVYHEVRETKVATIQAKFHGSIWIAFLVFGGMMIVFTAVPGVMIYNRFKRDMKKNVIPEVQ